MRVFVTGASGVVGRRAVPLLVAAGHSVTAIGRTTDKRAAIARAGAQPVSADLFDRAQIDRVIAGHDAIVNLATHMPTSSTRMMLPWSWRENNRIRREASALLVDAAIALGVSRFVQESFAPVYPDCGDNWIDERTPLAPVRYNRSVSDAEHSAERFTTAGGTGVVLRFAAFYGPDAFTTHDMGAIVRRGWSPLPGSPNAFISSISHDDAAAGVVAALGLPAGAYNVTDDEPLRRRDYVDVIANALNVEPPRFMPTWTSHLMGSLGQLLGRSLRMSNQKLRAAAPTWSLRFRSAREGLPPALEAR